MPKIYHRHFNEPSVLEYHTSPALKYFNRNFPYHEDFVIMNLAKGYCNGDEDAGVYLIPIHPTKTLESNFREHLYIEDARRLKPYKVIKDNTPRYYCIKCDKLAKIIKNEYKRPKNADECWSCFHGLK